MTFATKRGRAMQITRYTVQQIRLHSVHIPASRGARCRLGVSITLQYGAKVVAKDLG